jgi:SAM-dependent methyltransferase
VTPSIHPAAAEGFERSAQAYERGRPDFPGAAVAFVGEILRLGPNSRTLDLGAGTGKLTRLLVPFGGQVMAIEPVAGMRRELLHHAGPATIVGAVAEAIPLPDGWATGATVAQAFHWFDGDRALAEIHRVLAPAGRLALVWNRWSADRPWTRGLRELVESYRGQVPTHRSNRWQAAFDRTAAFTPLALRTFDYDHVTTAAAIVDRTCSISFIGALSDADRQTVGHRVREILAADPDTAGRAELRFPYRTEVWWCERR